MKTNCLSMLFLGVLFIISACSPSAIVSPSVELATPTVMPETLSPGYRPIAVDAVQVEVGVGSPIPVHVIVSGNLPDVCSQVEYTEIRQDGDSFLITLAATPLEQGCVQDTLPFKIGIPLSVVDLPAGAYTVTVNDKSAVFQLDTGNTTSSLKPADMPIAKDDIQVDAVSIDFGYGSPLPVHAIVSGNLPNACAQLGEVRMHRDASTFFVRLVAYVPAQGNCTPDALPFRLEIPLNIVNLSEGPYEVNVNGATASFDPRTTPAAHEAAPAPAGWMTHTSQRCEYALSYPPEMQVTGQDPYSRTLAFNLANPDEGARNFLYVSVIGPEIQNMVSQGIYQNHVYNYDPLEAEVLLNMQVGESRPVREIPNVESGFTFERKPDAQIGGYTAQSYENLQPWEFPGGTKEIRYYLPLDGCTYLIGGYMDTTGSDQPGAMTEDLFLQIIDTVRLTP